MPGPTSTLGLTQELFDMIATELLIKADDQFVFLQNVTPQGGNSWESGAKTITFNQPDLPTGTYTEASRRLTDATAVDTASIAITMSQKTLTVREYAGPHDGAGVKGFGLTEKLKTLAKHELVGWIGQLLRRDRNKHVNKRRMDDLLTATAVVTPDGSAEGAIAAGVKASAEWLRLMNKKMKDLLIPPFPNGRWKLIIGTDDEADLKRDPDLKQIFQGLGNSAEPAIFGKVAVYENFDIITDTLMPAGAAGAGGLVPSKQSVAFGPYHLGEQIITPPSPRLADETDYGRLIRMIWYSIEAVGPLYCDQYVVRGVTT